MIVGKLWDASTAAQQKKAEVILWKMVKNIAVNTTRYHGQNNQTLSLISFGNYFYKQNRNLDK